VLRVLGPVLGVLGQRIRPPARAGSPQFHLSVRYRESRKLGNRPRLIREPQIGVVLERSETLGRGVLSSSAVSNRHGYGGYENDGAITRFWHVRNRVLDSTLGRWTRRDPIGYVDGPSLFALARSNAVTYLDASGLACSNCRQSLYGETERCLQSQSYRECLSLLRS
jgi:RHS repeat-associated protein